MARRLLVTRCLAAALFWAAAAPAAPPTDTRQIEQGRHMYMEGVRPAGGLMTSTIRGDIPVTGEQAICGFCHRRSGLGSIEGQEVVPPVTGDLLYQPLRLPTSKPPLAPELRPAYTDALLKRAIRDGLDAAGRPLSPLMPRYDLSDEELEPLLAYLKQLSAAPAPGVTESEVHFATVVADDIDPATRKAYLQVFEAFFDQKNAGTRNEERRAAHPPWHKQWQMAPYRKWRLHVWELHGPPASWPSQLEAHYLERPVFAMLGGLAAGPWRPVHEFCESQKLPCVFPITDLPVIAEEAFYPLYLSKGMTLEAETVAAHLARERPAGERVIQLYREEDPRAATAAAALEGQLRARGIQPESIAWAPDSGRFGTLAAAEGATAVLWLGAEDAAALWRDDATKRAPRRIYLSAALHGEETSAIPAALRERVRFVHPGALADERRRLLMRSTGWLRSKRIYAPQAEQAQADAFFTLGMTAGAMKEIGGFFVREYFLEQFEHMADNATYTSIYPRVSLAPGQRFVVKGARIAGISATRPERLEALSEWIVPRIE